MNDLSLRARVEIRERFASLAADPDRALKAWTNGKLAPIPIRGFAVVEVPGSMWGRRTTRRLVELADQYPAVQVGPVLQCTGLLDCTMFLTDLPGEGHRPWSVQGRPAPVMHTSGMVDLPSPTKDGFGTKWLVPVSRSIRLTDPRVLALLLDRAHQELRRTGSL